jgi:hypothetical protein
MWANTTLPLAVIALANYCALLASLGIVLSHCLRWYHIQRMPLIQDVLVRRYWTLLRRGVPQTSKWGSTI